MANAFIPTASGHLVYSAADGPGTADPPGFVKRLPSGGAVPYFQVTCGGLDGAGTACLILPDSYEAFPGFRKVLGMPADLSRGLCLYGAELDTSLVEANEDPPPEDEPLVEEVLEDPPPPVVEDSAPADPPAVVPKKKHPHGKGRR